MDITELILRDHDEQRHLFALLDELEPDDTDALGAVWRRLRILLEVHAAAEEELFYPRLLDVGSGATDADDPEEETEDAIRDHNDIRDGIATAEEHPVGSEGWWSGVTRTREANSDHMGEEERQALADFRRNARVDERHRLGVEFAAYEAAHADGVDAADRDPAEYLARNS